MARGRPALPREPTKFLNSKKRIIYLTSTGKYVANTGKGKTVYDPKARFVKSPGGSIRTASRSISVPSASRRARRRNANISRGPRSGPSRMAMMRMFSTPKRRGRPPKRAMTPASSLAMLFKTPKMRKVRKNKGMKRGPRAGRASSLAMLFR